MSKNNPNKQELTPSKRWNPLNGTHPEVMADFIEAGKRGLVTSRPLDLDQTATHTVRPPKLKEANLERVQVKKPIWMYDTVSTSLSPSRQKPKIAGDVVSEHDLTAVQGESEFARAIKELFAAIRPAKILETGTYLGEGTTRVIATALRDLNHNDSVFCSIECNPDNYRQALQNLTSRGVVDRVTLLHGLSVPRAKLPTIDNIEERCVKNVEFDDIFVDHQEQQRALLYFKETDFSGVSDDLIGRVLQIYDFRPDFVLLDSGGHMGNIEFNYLISRLMSPCYLALDDVFHIKHHKSYLQMQEDPRFEILKVSREKFGFCIAKFTPATVPTACERHLLWVRTDSIGDNILSASMLPHIREHYHAAKISVVCQQHIAELYEICPFVDNVIPVPSELKWERREDYDAFIEKVRQLSPDILLNSTYSIHGISDLPGLEFIPERIAFRNAPETQYTRLAYTAQAWISELERHGDFLTALSIQAGPLSPVIWMDDGDERYAEEFFAGNLIDPQRTIALFPGARTFHRYYDPEKYAKAINAVVASGQFSFLILGGKGDSETTSRLSSLLTEAGHFTIDMAGRTTIRQMAALLKRVKLYVGTETAAAHICCAVGTPNVVLLGGGHFGRFMPYSTLSSIVCHPLECYGCNWNCRFDKIHCIESISPEIISQAVRNAIERDSDKIRIFTQRESSWDMAPAKQAWSKLDRFLRSDSIEIHEFDLSNDADRIRVGPPPPPDVSIIIATMNRAYLLDSMLSSLAEASRGISYEVIAIVGDCSDNTAEVLQKHSVKHIIPENGVFGPGKHTWPQLYNFGFAKASGRWAMYASDDIIFGPECLSQAVKYLDRQPSSVAGGIFFYRNLHAEKGWEEYGIDFTYGQKLLMNYGLVRLEDFRNVGGLDENYRFYCADGDLCFKLYSIGRQLIPLANCLVTHDNVMDVQKQSNLEASSRDIQLYGDKWKPLFPWGNPDPLRLIWSEEYSSAYVFPICNSGECCGIDQYWHALSWLTQGNIAKAAEKLRRAKENGYVLDTENSDIFTRKGCSMRLNEEAHINSAARESANIDTYAEIRGAGLIGDQEPLRLHLGCGEKYFNGYINIDYPPSCHNVMSPKADWFADITSLSFPPDSVDEIRLHHVFEHFNRVTALGLLIRWHGWLKTGGKLHIETPDLMGSCRTLLGDFSSKTKMGVVRHIAGDQAASWAYHVDHWYPERFVRTLSHLGFSDIHTSCDAWSQDPFLSNVTAIAAKSNKVPVSKLLAAADEILWESTVADSERPLYEVWRKQLREMLTERSRPTSPETHVEEELRQRLNENPRHVPSLVSLAGIELKRSNHRLAKRCLISALAIEPSNSNALSLWQQLSNG